MSVSEPTACVFVFDSKMPCHADLTHPVHHGAWKGPEPNHDFVYGGPPERKPTYREQVIATYLASPEAEKALAEALIAPLERRGADFHGPPPENGRDVNAVAREALATWRGLR